MKVSILDKPSEILLSTVSLAVDKQNPDNIWLFHCTVCGSPIAQVKGNVVGIFAGLEPTSSVVVVNQCYRCRANYTFQTRGKPEDEIKLTLERYQKEIFCCVICRTKLLDHFAHGLPFHFFCSKANCQKKYVLINLVSRDINLV